MVSPNERLAAESDAQFFRNIRWPMIVIALLGGHVTLMAVCVMLALASPPRIISTDSLITTDRPNASSGTSNGISHDASSPAAEPPANFDAGKPRKETPQ